MAYSILDRVYSIFIDIMTGISSGSGSATFYNTDKNTSYIELTVTNGVQSFNMSEYNYILVVNKPDKTSYKNSYSTTDNEKLVIALDSDMLSGIGTNSAQLYIMKSVDSVDKVITMIEFNYIVKPANYNELAPASKDSDSLYISLRNDVDSILSKIENGEIGSGGGGIVFEDTYVSNANQWLTNGYTKTSGSATSNLPTVCYGTKDRWGILFFIAENAANGTGTQMFFPIDGVYKGKIFTRSIVDRTKISSWTMLASEDSIIEAVNGTSGAITLSGRMYQRVDATGNIAITLPALTNDGTYKEIHLFYWSTSTYTITVASSYTNDKLFWESIPTVEANAITEFIFKKKDGAWMCRGITYRQQS